jgi:hypothetical protein
MQLRDHLLMSYRGSRSWPPAWVWIDGREDKRSKGEFGILRSVFLSKMQRPIMKGHLTWAAYYSMT